MRRPPQIYRGWWIVATVFASAALVIGTSQYSFGMFVKPLNDSFGWSRTQINASLSFAAVSGLAAPFLGRIMDHHGARPVIAGCLTLFGVSLLLRPLMTELWHWYALSILQFLGFSGATALPAGRLIGIWFQRNRGRVMGMAFMGNNFGGLVVPPIVGLTMGISSWRGAYLGMGALTLVVMVFALMVIREFPEGGQARPSGTGSAKSGRTGNPGPSLTGWTVGEALRSRAFYAISIAILLGTFTYSTVLPQVYAHLTNEGVPDTTASVALGLLAAFGMGGKLSFGLLAERITARYALILCLTGQAGFLILMLNAANPAIMWVSVPLFGLCMGAFGALFQLIVQESFGIRYFGSIMGLVSMGSVTAWAVGPLLAGASFDLTDRYHTAFIIVAVMFLVAAALLWSAGRINPDERPSHRTT
jgi:MFS family permease